MKIAAFNVAAYDHGHNMSFPPVAIVAIADSVLNHFSDAEVKIFDTSIKHLDDCLCEANVFAPDIVLVSVMISGYYDQAIQIFDWANSHDIPILAGGNHFCGVNMIPEFAVKNRGISVCLGDGENTVVEYLDAIINGKPLDQVSNLCFFDGRGIKQTCRREISLTDKKYPTVPISVFDPRQYWQKGEYGGINGVKIGKTVILPSLTKGCLYRYGKVAQGGHGCRYCSLGYCGYTKVSPEVFWDRARQSYGYVEQIPWHGNKGLLWYLTGDSFATDFGYMKELRKSMPEWYLDAPAGFRSYAFAVSCDEHAKILSELRINRLYIGADGKDGYTSVWSDSHPIVKTLRHCQKYDIHCHLGFVLGQYGQSFASINRWLDFRSKLVSEFGNLIQTNGWVNIITPGSLDWSSVCGVDPSLARTDNPDLVKARMVFIREFTLFSSRLSAETVVEKLYKLAEEFDSASHDRFMV